MEAPKINMGLFLDAWCRFSGNNSQQTSKLQVLIAEPEPILSFFFLFSGATALLRSSESLHTVWRPFLVLLFDAINGVFQVLSLDNGPGWDQLRSTRVIDPHGFAHLCLNPLKLVQQKKYK